MIVYIPLILKILFTPLSGAERSRLAKGIGILEYFISPWRDTIVALFLLGFSIYSFVQHQYPSAFINLGLVLLSAFNLFHRYQFRKALCLWTYKQDNIEPGEFFDTYYRGLGSFRNPFPGEAKMVSFELLDYRSGKNPKKILSPLFLGAIDTATLAKLAIFAMQHFEGKKGPNGIDMFDTFARIWGARFVQRAKIALRCEGLDRIQNLQGKTLLVFNHKSYLDFALNFFALGGLRNAERHLRPRFIAAKDHFIDNPLIYSWIGLGKCIEKAGMIFINRNKGKGWLAMQEAAQKLIDQEVEVAVYPQGTRAWGLKNEKGERIDAGYYTTFSKRNFADLQGHLKIGTAQLILDTALTLKEKNQNLQVLFVGIDGSATVGPKGSFKIQSETEVIYRLGKLWRVDLPHLPFENPQGKKAESEAAQNYQAQLESIQDTLDREIEKSIARHPLLAARFIKDLPQEDERLINQVIDFLEREDAIENKLPFVILDRLYALPVLSWKSYQDVFLKLVLEKGTDDEWKKLLELISLQLLKK